MNQSDLTVTLTGLPPMSELERVWVGLQAQSEHSFFMSWAWIGCWLDTLPSRISPYLLCVKSREEVVGLGILISNPRTKFGFLSSPSFYLNATGDPELDEITVEHNGFLVNKHCSNIVKEAVLNFLFDSKTELCDECFIDGTLESHLRDIAIPLGARIVSRRVRACYFVSLAELKESGVDYLSTLSATRRRSIRRSIREYQTYGELTIESAITLGQALLFLGRLKQFHQAYWKKRSLSGSFANSFFEKFITQLVSSQQPRRIASIARLAIHTSAIGKTSATMMQTAQTELARAVQSSTDARNPPFQLNNSCSVKAEKITAARLYAQMAGKNGNASLII